MAEDEEKNEKVTEKKAENKIKVEEEKPLEGSEKPEGSTPEKAPEKEVEVKLEKKEEKEEIKVEKDEKAEVKDVKEKERAPQEEKVKEEPNKEKAEKIEEKKVKEEEVEEVVKKKVEIPEPEKEVQEELIPGLSPLIFGKYNMIEVVVEDPGLRRYINLHPIGIPHTGAKHANKWFGKTNVNIVERLINNMMRTEHSTGKKSFAYKTVRKAFDIIAKRTKKNPIQVLIYALQNSSPKEEITRLRFGGISVPKAVDTSSSHRLDVALRNICKGAVSSSHKNKKHVEMCLAEEIILASKADMNSFAISKKEEMERIAASAR